MKQTSLPFTLRPLLLACGIYLAVAPAFAANAPRTSTPGPLNISVLRDGDTDPGICLSAEAPPTVLARVTTALTVVALHQAEPGFVLIDDVDPGEKGTKDGPRGELAAASLRPSGPVPKAPNVDVTSKPVAKPSKLSQLTDIPREWADKVKALSAHISEKFNVDESYASKVVKAVMKAGDETGISSNLLLAVIAVESHFQPLARNGNARGLMQIIPFWHKQKVTEVGGAKELMKPEKNIAVGSAILKDYMDRSDTVFQALKKYNASTHATEYSARVLRQQQSFDAVLVPR